MFSVETPSKVSSDTASTTVDHHQKQSIYSFLFSLKGRASRGMYFVQSVLSFVAFVVFMMGFTAVMDAAPFSEHVAMLVTVLGFGVYLWSGVVITVRRLHDLGRSGWHFFLLGLPFYNFILYLVLLLRRGNHGLNEYGEDPCG